MNRLSSIIFLSICIPDIIAFTAIQKQQQAVLLSSQLHVSKTTIPDLASETKPIDESNIFSDCDDAQEDNNDDASWQKNLDLLLAPNTSTTKRQIVLSDLLSSGDEIQESVRTALRERKVSAFLYFL